MTRLVNKGSVYLGSKPPLPPPLRKDGIHANMMLAMGFCNLARTDTDLGRRRPRFDLVMNDIQKYACGIGSTFLGNMV